MNIIPCGHRLVIKPIDLKEHDVAYAAAARAGIQLLDMDERKQQIAIDRGTVISVGSTAFKDFGGEAWCAVGDQVGFAKFGGKYIKDPETKEDFLILNDEDVICVFKKELV